MSQSPTEYLSLLNWATDPHLAWDSGELSAIMQHQLSAPLVFDRNEVGCDSIDSFEALFSHDNPPVELLRLVKVFAKTAKSDGGQSIPEEVATVLYYTSIAIAHTRCRHRISTMADERVINGLLWIVNQAWVDKKFKTFVAGLTKDLRRQVDAGE